MASKLNRKGRRKLETPKRQYALRESALYALRGKNQLLRVLLWTGTFDELETLSQSDCNYKCWVENNRPVQEARPRIRVLQARIATLLRRIAPPDYRHSGVRKRSFLSNAQIHLHDQPMLQFDLRKFYPSTTFKHVFNFFRFQLTCAADLADLLARICCFEGNHLPTGGVHSEVLAFYCHKTAFDAIDSRAKERGGRMSTYVDDVGITAPEISLTDLEWIRALMAKRGLTLHPGKSFVTRKLDARTITGVWISRGRAYAPPEQQLKIRALNGELIGAPSIKTARYAACRLMGHYDHVAQIERRYRTVALGNRARLMSLLKL